MTIAHLDELAQSVWKFWQRYWNRADRTQADQTAFLSVESLEIRVMPASHGLLVADYFDDFQNVGESDWQYLWNAPDGWTAGGDIGDLSTGAIGDPASYVPLERTGNQLSADGDLVGNLQSPDRFLRFYRFGGHPGAEAGMEFESGNDPQTNDHDRYTIAAFTVNRTGLYEIRDSLIDRPNDVGDAVEVLIHVNHEDPVFQETVSPIGKKTHFDTTLGYLNAGDTIYVAFGPGEGDSYDFFRSDFSIYRASSEIVVADYTDDFSASGTHADDWQYLWNAPLGWTPDTGTGDLGTGAIDDVSSYLPLISAGSFLTADGNLNGAHQPDAFIRLGPGAGHPGQAAKGTNAFDRFAVAQYTVQSSGLYEIYDSHLTLPVANGLSDGVELRVSVNGHEELFRQIVDRGSAIDFDFTLGYLSAGDTIEVAFGANGQHANDFFLTDYSIVRIVPRAEPLRELNTTDTIDVASFGAIPDDGQDDRQAVQLAINTANEINGVVKIVFQPGTYHFDSRASDTDQQLLKIIGASNLEINGQGSEFIVGDPTRGLFRVDDSSNIIFRDFSVDYSILPFTHGTITDVNGNLLTIEIDPGMPLPDDSHFSDPAAWGQDPSSVIKWGHGVDPDVPGRLAENTAWTYGTNDLIAEGNGRYTFRVASPLPNNLQVGDSYVLNARYNRALFNIKRESSQVTLSGVTAYAAPGTFVSVGMSRLINLIDSHVRLKPGRLRSIDADAVHVQAVREGVWIESSTFEGVGDDVMNFYTFPFTILEATNNNQTLRLERYVTRGVINPLNEYNFALQFQVGDHLVFFDPKVTGGQTQRILDRVRIISVDASNRTVTVDHPVNGIEIGTGPDYRDDVSVYNADLSSSFLIQDSTIANSRRYGLYLMANNGQVVDSVYTGLSDEAIAGRNETAWPLGLFANDILIQGNEFRENGFSYNYLSNELHAGTVAFSFVELNPDVSFAEDRLANVDEYGHLNIDIRDNTFYDWRRAAISVRNSRHVNISDNFIFDPLPLPGSTNTAIDIRFSDDVVEINNTIS